MNSPKFKWPINSTTKYDGAYRGIAYEIVNWFFKSDVERNEPNWNYYVWLQIDRIADPKLAKKFWPITSHFPNKHKTPYVKLQKIPFQTEMHFHGGLTYAKKYEIDGQRSIKLGCDYGHLFDRGNHYTVESISHEVQKTIDMIHELMDYKVWCSKTSQFIPEKQGYYDDKGDFQSKPND